MSNVRTQLQFCIRETCKQIGMMPHEVLVHGVSVKDIIAWRLTSPEAMAGILQPYKVPEVARFLEITEKEARDGIDKIDQIIGYHLVGSNDATRTLYAIGLCGAVLVRIEATRTKRLGGGLREDTLAPSPEPSSVVGGLPAGPRPASVVPRNRGDNDAGKPLDRNRATPRVPKAP